MGKDPNEAAQHRQSKWGRREEFKGAIRAWNSNLYGLLVSKEYDTRFLKIMAREDETFLAIAGSWNEVGEPMVAFGNGETILGALESLAKSLAGGQWREDKFAKG